MATFQADPVELADSVEDLVDVGRGGNWWWPVGGCILIGLALLSLGLGRYQANPLEIALGALSAAFPGLAAQNASVDQTVLFQIRVPRVLGAILVGAALSGSGAAYQSMFRNPAGLSGHSRCFRGNWTRRLGWHPLRAAVPRRPTDGLRVTTISA